MTEWNNVLNKSINRILSELSELDYIREYAPKVVDDLQEYNDQLVAFKRLYYDMYRFINKYIRSDKFEYILTLYPRHVYWSITPIQLNYIIMFIKNDNELDLVRYLIDIGLPNNSNIHDKYIWLLGQEKMQYINLKNADEYNSVI